MGYDIVLNVLNLYRDFSLSLDLEYVFAQDVFIVHKFFVTAIWKEKEKLKALFFQNKHVGPQTICKWIV